MPYRTRQRIINILKQRETASALELSKILKVTPSNIRHHLSILVEQGRVKISGHLVSHERGRPATMYTLAQFEKKENLDLISSILFHKLFDDLPKESRERELISLAQSIAVRFPQNNHNPTQRLYTTIQTLNNLNYRAHWEARADTPRIMLGHCPYASILDDHPEMCIVDTHLVEQLTGSPVNLVAKRDLNVDGHYQCIFRIIKK